MSVVEILAVVLIVLGFLFICLGIIGILRLPDFYTRLHAQGKCDTLGVTLMTMGEDVSGTKILEQAAACFRQSLEVRRREVAPLMWAQTANNLGAVTFSLYRRTENASTLNEAAACFEGAAEVYEQFKHPHTAAIARNNLSRVRAAEGA